MKEYIEKDTVFQIIAAQCGECADTCLEFDGIQPDCNQCLLHGAAKIIETVPPSNARPAVRGRWEDVEVTYVADKTTLPFERISSMRCNQCNRYHTEIYYYGDPTEMANYCPNCGADMRATE